MSPEVLPFPGPRLERGVEPGQLDRPPLSMITLWRAAVALSGLTGVWLAALRYDVWWTALSQLASVAVAITYAALAAYPHVSGDGRTEPRSPWVRGALATVMVLVAGAYLVMTGADLSAPYSFFEHLLTPLLVVVDYLFVGANQHAVRWWHPLTWLVAPTAYLGWYVAADLGVYVDLDPSRPTEFASGVGMLLWFGLLVGFALYAFGRVCRLRVPPSVTDR